MEISTMIGLCKLVQKSVSSNSPKSNTPSESKRADENVNNSKIKMNVKMQKNRNTVPPFDSREGFHKVTMPSNVLNYSPKGGT